MEKKTSKKNPKEETIKLKSELSFWMLEPIVGEDPGYKERMKEIGSFSTIKGFWHHYCHLKRPRDIPPGAEIHLFRKGVKPLWEDEKNKNGGKWMIRCDPKFADYFWEKLTCALVGGLFDDLKDEVSGVVCGVRSDFCSLSVWNRTCDYKELTKIIREKFEKTLKLIGGTRIEYKPHVRDVEKVAGERIRRDVEYHIVGGSLPVGGGWRRERDPHWRYTPGGRRRGRHGWQRGNDKRYQRNHDRNRDRGRGRSRSRDDYGDRNPDEELKKTVEAQKEEIEKLRRALLEKEKALEKSKQGTDKGGKPPQQ